MTSTDARERWSSARRRVAWQHHPDRGGDPTVLARELARVDAELGPARPLVLTPDRRLRRRVGRRLRHTSRTVRASLPSRVPGARRYIDL